MFCKTVWGGLFIMPDGYIRLCSIGHFDSNTRLPAGHVASVGKLDNQRCRDKDGNVMHILTHSIQEIMNSDKHREVRLFNVNNPNKWSAHCECCKNREVITNFDRKHPNSSRRVYLNYIKNDDVVSENTFQNNKIDSQGNINWMPSSLDINFGNLCNQKCIMCSPTFSNLWYEEYLGFYGNLTFGHGKQITIIKNTQTGKWDEPAELHWFEDPRWWSKFETMMPYLKHIYVTGGEPMVTPAHDIMLDKLIDSGYAKNIWLEYDTNCSAINPKIVQRWNHFRLVHVRGSIEATEKQYELVRYLGKWEKFQENVQLLKEYGEKSNGKIQLLTLTTCFQMSTMYSIIETEKWCKSKNIPFHVRFLEGPLMHCVACLDDEDKEKLIEYYNAFRDTSEKAPLIIKHLKKHMGSNHSSPKSVAQFIKFMDYLDTTRNTDWKNILPKVHKLVEKYNSVVSFI